MPRLALPVPSRSITPRAAPASRALALLAVALLAVSPARGAAAERTMALPLALLQASTAPRVDTTSSAAPVTPQSPRATRAQLTAALERAEQAATQGSQSARVQARSDASVIRTRLTRGDFQAGDRIAVTIGGDTTRRDVTVRDGVEIDLPYGIPSLSLVGILRSELTGAVEAHLRKYVRDPDVRARALQRLSVTGAVGRPGVYWVASDVPVAELVMLAGGTSSTSRLDRITVHRGGRQVIDRGTYARLVTEGRTIEDAGVQPGDEVRVPLRREGRNIGQTVTYAFFAISALTAVLALIRASYQ
jgi:Arc/MetJ family transcription regulator